MSRKKIDDIFAGLDKEKLKFALNGAKDEVKDEARDLLKKVGSWAVKEFKGSKSLESYDNIKFPTGGPQLAKMSLDEAVARSQHLETTTKEKLETYLQNKKEAADIAKAALSIALRALVTGAKLL